MPMGNQANTVSKQIWRAMMDSDISRYRLWKLTGISQAALSRFAHKKVGLGLDGLVSVADALDLEIIVQPKKKTGRK